MRWVALMAAAAAIMISMSACSSAPSFPSRQSTHVGSAAGISSAELVVQTGAESLRLEAANLGTRLDSVVVSPGGAVQVRSGPQGVVSVTQRQPQASGIHLNIELSRLVSWHIVIRGGTTNAVLDLTGIRLLGLQVSAGAESLTLDLPHPSGRVMVTVTGGTTDLALRTPGGIPMQVVVGAGIALTTVNRSVSAPTGYSRTFTLSDYSTAAASYSVHLEGGAARLTVTDR